jgi:DNA repair photolyase
MAKTKKTGKCGSTRGQRVTGTKEWAVQNVNIVLGCEHRCRYCYARWDAKFHGRVKSLDEWGTTYLRLRPEEVRKRRRDYGGTVTFPTTHDITPEHLDSCVEVLRKLLEAGNKVLIVSKPHLVCIQRLCQEFAGYQKQILFRFTIGAMDDRLLEFWEPGAPRFSERLTSLKCAYKHGFFTSVSIEPMLDTPNVQALFRTLRPYVTDSIWLGKMNKAKSRVSPQTLAEKEALARIDAQQTDEKILVIYEALKGDPLARWKDSVKKVVGLPPAAEAGLDV